MNCVSVTVSTLSQPLPLPLPVSASALFAASHRQSLTGQRHAGMWLFFNVNLYQDAGEFMDDNVSYAHFGTAFFSLFRQTTGEAWNGIMYYCSETDPYLGCALTNSGFLVSSHIFLRTSH